MGKLTDQPSVNASQSFDPRTFCLKDRGSAVVLVYRHFDRFNRFTSINTDQFVQQMDFFKNKDYKIVTLDQILQVIQNKTHFGKRWVAITIDGAYRSFYTKAKPVLEKYGYPYTVFVNTKSVEQSSDQFMKWEELREIAKSNLGHLGSHAHTQKYLLREMNEEQRKKDIISSVEKIYKNTGVMPFYFSYPFGEFSNQFINEVKSIKQIISRKEFYFKAAFSRTAGPIGCSSNVFALPRFMMNQAYGAVDDSFKIKVNSRHLPVYSVYPGNAAICAGSKTDKLYFSTSDELDLKGIRCYSNKYKPHIQVAKGLVSVHLNRPIGFVDFNGKQSLSGRVNCIMQTQEEGVFFWHGYSWRVFGNSKRCFTQ